MQPTYYKGVPFGNLLRANRWTVPGSLIDVNRYRYSHGIDEANAILATKAAIKALPLDASQNSYHRQLATDVYNVQLNGLGDGNQQLPASVGGGSNPAGGSAGWFGVLQTVAGNISQGVACKISGACKAQNLSLPMPPPAVPWGTIALAGGGGLLLLMMLRRKSHA